MRLIDADAYAAEMKERQDACMAAMEAETYEGEQFSVRQHWEGVFAAFVEAKLALDDMPTVELPKRPAGTICRNCGFWVPLDEEGNR